MARTRSQGTLPAEDSEDEHSSDQDDDHIQHKFLVGFATHRDSDDFDDGLPSYMRAGSPEGLVGFSDNPWQSDSEGRKDRAQDLEAGEGPGDVKWPQEGLDSAIEIDYGSEKAISEALDSDEDELPTKPSEIIRSLGASLKIKIPPSVGLPKGKQATRTPAIKAPKPRARERRLAAKKAEKAALAKKAGKCRARASPRHPGTSAGMNGASAKPASKKERAVLASKSPTKSLNQDFVFCDDITTPVQITAPTQTPKPSARGRGRPPLSKEIVPLDQFSVHAFVLIEQTPFVVQKTSRANKTLETAESPCVGPVVITHKTTWSTIIDNIARCISRHITKENMDLTSLRWRLFPPGGTSTKAKATLAGWLPMCDEDGFEDFLWLGVYASNGMGRFLFSLSEGQPEAAGSSSYGNPAISSPEALAMGGMMPLGTTAAMGYTSHPASAMPAGHMLSLTSPAPGHLGFGMPPGPVVNPWTMGPSSGAQFVQGQAGFQHVPQWGVGNNASVDLDVGKKSVKKTSSSAGSLEKLTPIISKLVNAIRGNPCRIHTDILCAVDLLRQLHFRCDDVRLEAWASDIAKGRANIYQVPVNNTLFKPEHALPPLSHLAPAAGQHAQAIHPGFSMPGGQYGYPLQGPPMSHPPYHPQMMSMQGQYVPPPTPSGQPIMAPYGYPGPGAHNVQGSSHAATGFVAPPNHYGYAMQSQPGPSHISR